jgi:hypothetical protein
VSLSLVILLLLLLFVALLLVLLVLVLLRPFKNTNGVQKITIDNDDTGLLKTVHLKNGQILRDMDIVITMAPGRAPLVKSLNLQAQGIQQQQQQKQQGGYYKRVFGNKCSWNIRLGRHMWKG